MVQHPRWAEMCARILQQCEYLQGGRAKLAEFLGVKEAELAGWLEGRSPSPSRAVFERAMELILAEHDRRAAREAAGVPRRRRSDRATA